MKKIITVIIITAFLMAGVLYTPKLVETYLPQTSVTMLKNIDYVESISATGEVSKENSKTVTSDIPLVVSKILVKEGDSIKVGQALISVNKAETAKKMMQINEYSSLADLGAGSTVTSYDDVLALIPEKVTSNIAGTIDSVDVTAGDYISADDTIVTMIGSDGLIITASVSENNISNVAVGQNVIITGSGFSAKEYYGVVEEISNVAKKQYIGTTEDTFVSVKIRFNNVDENIRVGYSANVKILTSEQKNITIVPYEAVMEDDKNSEYVYVFNNGIAVRKDIETGVELGDGVEVISGVTSNDHILTSPDKVTEGAYVKVVKE